LPEWSATAHALGFISGERAETMNKIVTVAIVAAGIVAAGIGLAPIAAGAQERAGDAALGALSGALVGGPIGLVAGGVVGFTAGPSIARSWGLRNRHYRARRTASRH
jgi:hypothetical protein